MADEDLVNKNVVVHRGDWDCFVYTLCPRILGVSASAKLREMIRDLLRKHKVEIERELEKQKKMVKDRNGGG